MGQQAKNYKILIVDDDVGLCFLFQKILQREGYQTAGVGNGQEAIAWLTDHQADLMLLDYKLPDMNGRQVIEALKNLNKLIPFILITGQGDEKLAVEMLKSGARDYIIKDGGFLDLLGSVATQALEQIEQQKQLKQTEAALQDSEARYHGVFNYSLDTIVVLNDQGIIIDANPPAARLFDYLPSELLNMPFRRLIHPDYHQSLDIFMEDLRDAGETQAESMGRQKDGTMIDIEIRGAIFVFKGQKLILLVLRDISERKWKEEELRLTNQQLRVSEKALRERESRLTAIFQGAAIGVALLELSGRFVETNQSLQKMLGYNRQELREKVFTDCTHPDDLPAGVQIFNDLSQGRCNYYQLETRYIRKDGEIIWVRLVASLLRNEEGKPHYIINMMEDISDRKIMEQRLRDSQERFRLLSEASFEGILIHDQGKIIDGNLALARMFGYDIEEIIGKYCWDFIAAEYQNLVINNVRREVTAPYDIMGVRKDGGTFDIQVWPSAIQYKDKQVRVVAVRNITEQKKAERALQKSEERYRGLFENMHNGFAYHQIILNEEGYPQDYVFLEVNDAFERLTGLKRRQVLGKSITQVIPTIKTMAVDLIEIYGAVALTGLKKAFEFFFEPVGKWFMISTYSIQKGYFAVIIEDITERRQMEEEMRVFAADLERSNRELEQFAYLISRHLQEPLRRLAGTYEKCADCCSRHGPADMAELIRQNSALALRLQHQVDALLAYTQLGGRGRPCQNVNLESVARQACATLQDKIKLAGGDVHIADLPTLAGDERQLQILFENLIDNALKYRRNLPPQIHVKNHSTDLGYEITIADNGIGINPQVQPHIFDIFYRSGEENQYPDSRIGLAMAKKIVEYHGGRIWVESQLDQGSTFHIFFPIKNT